MKTIMAIQMEAEAFLESWICGNFTRVINEIVNLPTEQAMYHAAYMSEHLGPHKDGFVKRLRSEALNST